LKKLLLLPLLLVTCFCFAQDAKEIIGNSIKIGSLEIAQYDFPKEMKWEDALKACNDLGEGWRLPTKDELNELYKNKDKIGGFATSTLSSYWSSTESGLRFAWLQYFSYGTQKSANKLYILPIRAVRSL
jgi:hypothetical protein